MRRERELGKGLIAGLIGGLIGTIVMSEFQNAWGKASQALKKDRWRQPEQSQRKVEGQEKEDATMRAAGKIISLTGRRLSHEQKKKYGPVVHYSFGTMQGGIYGMVTEMAGVAGGLVPALLFGASLFVVADEIAVPAMGFTTRPRETPVSAHLYGLASHLVYGLSTEIARRGVRTALG